MQKARVAVLGGGPAGAVAALVLAGGGIDTTLLEARPGPEPKIGETLPPEVRPLLGRLGLLDRLEAPDHRPSFGNRSYWGSEEAAERDFLFGAHGSGWHLDRRRFEAMLAAEAASAGAHWLWDHHAVDAVWRDRAWALEVEGPNQIARIEADFVVDATGRPARFALGAGAHKTHLDKLVGVAATVDTAGRGARLDSFTLVEAVENGWWYSAALTGGRLVAVFMSDGDLIDVKSARTRDGWLALMKGTRHTRARLEAQLSAGGSEPVAPVVVPAGSACLDVPCGEGWLAVGDSAASYDPLSSHGIGSAMTTGYYGACAVADALHGRAEALETYSHLVQGMFSQYLGLLHEHYALEQRWPRAHFWRRRHEAS